MANFQLKKLSIKCGTPKGKTMYQNIIVIALVIFVAFFVGVAAGVLATKNNKNYKSNKSMAQHWHDRADYKTGCSQKHGNYQYVTFDGGQNWYELDIEASDYKKTKKWDSANRAISPVVIIGHASPEHLAELAGMDALIQHAMKNGSLKFDAKNLKTSTKLLSDAGFTVTKKTEQWTNLSNT